MGIWRLHWTLVRTRGSSCTYSHSWIVQGVKGFPSQNIPWWLYQGDLGDKHFLFYLDILFGIHFFPSWIYLVVSIFSQNSHSDIPHSFPLHLSCPIFLSMNIGCLYKGTFIQFDGSLNGIHNKSQLACYRSCILHTLSRAEERSLNMSPSTIKKERTLLFKKKNHLHRKLNGWARYWLLIEKFNQPFCGMMAQ